MSDWVMVDGFPDYDVNRLGQVRNGQTARLMTVSLNQFGVARVTLADETGKQHQRSLALIVAKAFVPRPALELFNTPINLDGDRFNCAAENLVWRPRWFALQYHKQFEYPVVSPYPIRDIKTGDVYHDSREVAMRFGLLEKELVISMANRTYAFPTFQLFDWVD